MLEDFEFRLRTRTENSSLEAILINYLNSKDTLYPAKDMVMIALMSYWLPQACQAAGLNIEPHIRSSLYRLKLHEQYLLQLLGESPTPIDAKTIDDELINDLPDADSKDLSQTTSVEPPTPSLTPVVTLEKELQTDWLNPFNKRTQQPGVRSQNG